MILVIDNYDSFTYNLVQYIGSIVNEIEVKRNDRLSIDYIEKNEPTHIIISPGPGRPENAGLCIEIIKEFGDHIPILGVCLGHQAIAVANGAEVVISPQIVHGKCSEIIHSNNTLFKTINSAFLAARYHSLIVKTDSLPNKLEIIAKLEDGTIMGLKLKSKNVYGIQFHPESIATQNGLQIIKNFLEIKS